MKYNCCTNGELPDMSEFTQLEVNAVYEFASKEGNFCEPLFGVASGKAQVQDYVEDPDQAKFFYSVYGRHESGEAEALHDEFTLEAIMVVANKLSSEFGLEIELR